MSLRKLGRTAMVVAIAATSLVIVAPAQADGPLTISVSCEPTTRLHVLCSSTVSGGSAPYLRRWYYNNRYFSTQDNLSYTGWSCTLSGPNQYNLAVIDANSEIIFGSAGSGCNSGNF